MSPRSSLPDESRFELEMLEPRLLLSGENPLHAGPNATGNAAAFSAPRAQEVVWHAEEEDLLLRPQESASADRAEEPLFDDDADVPALTETTTPAIAEVAEATTDATEDAVTSAETEGVETPSDPSLSGAVEDATAQADEPLSIFTQKQAYKAWWGRGPPATDGDHVDQLEVTTYDLTGLVSDGLAAVEGQLAAWVEKFNLSAIDPALTPDAIADLFDLVTAVASVDFDTLVAETKEALVDALTNLGFTVTAIEGGLSNGTYSIDPTTGTDRILATWSTDLASNLSVAGDYTGETFDTTSEGLLTGVGSGLTPTDAFAWSGDLTLELDLGVDDQGFFLAEGSGLSLAMSADGTMAGTADLFGDTGASVSIEATADFSVGLEFNDTAPRYRASDFTGDVSTLLTPTASGTADAKIHFTYGPTDLNFEASYTLATDAALTFSQSVDLSLAGTLALPGFKMASDGSDAVLNLTGAYDSGSDTWTLTAQTADLLAFGFSVNSASFEIVATDASFAGSGSAAMTIDFLQASSAPIDFNLSANFDDSSLTLQASATATDLSFLGNSGSTVFLVDSASLNLDLTGDFGADTLTGSIDFALGSATFNPGQTSYTVSATDGDDTDSDAMTGSYDFGTETASLSIDQFELKVMDLVQATAAAVALTYSRSSSDDDQTILSIDTLDVALLAFAKGTDGKAPTFSASTVVVSEGGFSIASGTVDPGDLEIGGFLHVAAPSLTISALAYDSTDGLSGTIEVTAASASLFSGSSFTVNLTDGDDADAFAITGSFDASTLAFSLSVDQLSVNVPEVFSAEGSGITLAYAPGGDGHQEIFRLEDLSLEFLSFQTSRGSNLTASVSGLSFFADGFLIDTVSVPASGGSLGDVSVGGFLTLTDPTLTITNLGYVDGSGLSGTIDVTVASASLFSGSSFTVDLTDGDDADAFAIMGAFDASTLAFSLSVDQLSVNVPEVFSAEGSGITLAYTPGGDGHQEIFRLEDLSLEFLSFQTSGGSNLTASVSGLSFFADGFLIDTVSVPASGSSLGDVSVGGFLTLSDPTLTITNLGYVDGSGLSGTIDVTAASASLFSGSSFTVDLTDGDDADAFAITGAFDVSTLAFSLSVDQLSVNVPEVFSAEGAGITLAYAPGGDGHQQIFRLEDLSLEFLSFQTSGGSNLTASVSGLSFFADGFLIDTVSVPTSGGSLGEVSVGGFLTLGDPTLTITNLGYVDGDGLSGTIDVTAASASLFSGSSFTVNLTDGDDADAFAITGSFDASTLAFALSVDQLSVNVPEVFSAEGSGITLAYAPGGDGHQEIFRLEDLSLEFLSFQTSGGSNLTASVSGLSFFADGFLIDTVSVPASGSSLGDVSVGGFLTLSDPTLTITNLGYIDGSGLSGTIDVTAASASLFSGSSFTVNLTDGDDADAFAITGSFDASTLAFALSVDQLSVNVPEVFSAEGSGITLAYTPGGDGHQEIFRLEDLSLEFLSFQTSGGSNLTASVSGLSFFADGFLIDTVSVPASGSSLGDVSVGGFLTLTDPTLTITNLGYVDGDGLSGTIEVTAASASLFSGSSFTVDLTDGNDADAFAITGSFDASTLAFSLSVDQLSVNVPEVFSAEGSGTTLAYTPGGDGHQQIFRLEDLSLEFLSFQTNGGSNLTASVSGLSFFADGFLIDTVSVPASGSSLGDVSVGGFLTLNDPTLTITNLGYVDGSGLSGTIDVTAASASLFSGSSFTVDLTDGDDADAFAITGSFDASTLAFALSVDQLSVNVPEVFSAEGSGITLAYAPGGDGHQEIFRLEDLSLEFLSFQTSGGSNLTASVSGLSFFADGFLIDTVSVPASGNSLGDVSIGDFLTLTDPTLTITNLGYVDGSGLSGTIDVTVASASLFTGSSFTVNLTDGDDADTFAIAGAFDASTLAFALTIDQLDLQIGEAAQLTGSGIALSYDPNGASDQELVTIDELTLVSPLFSSFGTASLTGFVLRADGFSFTNLNLTQTSEEARVGNYLAVSGAVIAADSFDVSFGSGTTVTGAITLSATSVSLFPDGGLITSSLESFSGSFVFRNGGSGELKITVGDFSLAVGEALQVSASNVVLTPSEDPILTLETAVVSSPVLKTFGSAVINNLEIGQTQFSVENLTLAQPAGQTTTLGNFLSFSGVKLVVAGASAGDAFTVNYGDSDNPVSGTITLTADSVQLFPNGGVVRSSLDDFTASFDFSNGGQLSLSFNNFSLSVGEALVLTAPDTVTITPGESLLATIPSLTVTSPSFSAVNFSVTGLELRQDGFSLEKAEFDLGTVSVGSVVEFENASLTVAGPDADSPFSLSYGDTGVSVEGGITLSVDRVSLFAGSSFVTSDFETVTVEYDFSDAGRLHIHIGSFVVQLGEALRIEATDAVDLYPGSETVATIAAATVTSPQFGAEAGSFSLTDFVIAEDGFFLGSGNLSVASVSLGSFLDFTNLTVEVDDFGVTFGVETEISGSITVTMDAMNLFPNGGYLTSRLENVTALYDFGASDGALVITVGTFSLSVGEALAISAQNVEITPGAETIATLGSAVLTAPAFEQFGSATVEDLEITQTGFSLQSLTLSQADDAPVWIGNFLKFSGLEIAVAGNDGDPFTVTAGESPTGTITLSASAVELFPNSGVIQSDLEGFSASYDFDNGGALQITFTRFALSIGEALHLVAASASDGSDAPVTISPSADVLVSIPYLEISSPLIQGLEAASITDLEVRPEGFSFTSATIAQASGATATIGSVLSVSGASITAAGPDAQTPFSVNYGDSGVSLDGEITFTADSLALFPDAGFFTTKVTGFAGSYDFSAQGGGALTLTMETLELDVGEALRLSAGTAGVADGIVITPGSETILTIGTLTVSSPLITSGLNTATVTDFTVTQDGFAFDEFTISQVSGQTASIGSFLDFSGLQISVSNFAYSTNDGVSGAVLFSADTILLFASSTLVTTNLTGISGEFAFGEGGDGSLTIGVQSFDLMIGEALKIDASSITLTPGAETIAQIASATANSPRIANLGSVAVENLAIRQDGFSFSSLTIQQKAGVVSTFGNFLSFSGVELVVAGPQSGGDFDLSFGDSGVTLAGSITISIEAMTLFPDADFLTSDFAGVVGSFDFEGGSGSLSIAIDSFSLAVGEAFKLEASGADASHPIMITPGAATLVTLPSVTVSSSLVKGIESGSLTDLVITQTGFSFASLSLAQASGETASIGSFFTFADASLEISNFAVSVDAGEWSVGGSVEIAVGSMSLFPGASFLTSTFTGVDASFDFGSGGVGSLAIAFETLDLQIGEALKISSATGGTFTPGQLTMLTLNDLSVTAPGIQGMGTGTISRLVVRQDGLSIGSLTIGQASGATAQFGDFLTIEGAQLTVSNFSIVNGDSGVSVSGGIVFTADSLSLFPGSDTITTEISSFTGSYSFGDGSGALEIDVGTFKLSVGSALEVSASGVTITPGSTTIATVETASVKAPEFANLPEITLSNGLTITQTGLTIGAVNIQQATDQTATLGSIFSFTGLEVSLTGFSYTFGETPTLDGITVSATEAAVFPGSSLFTAKVEGFSGSYAGGDLELTATSFTFSFGTSLTVTAEGLSFTPSEDTIAQAASVTASIPSLGVSGTGTGLEISSGGDFSIVSVSLDTSGLAQAIGLGSLLPFNITELDLSFLGDTNHNGQRDPGETFDLTAFDLTVQGTFDFSSLSSLPFTPIIRIGVADDTTPPSDGGTQSGSGAFDSADDSFSFTIEVVDGSIRPKDLGPITLGFADLKIGSTVVMSGLFTLGGYQDGQWVSSFAGSLQMENSDTISGITGASASIVGTYDGAAGRLVAFANLTVSFKMGDAVQVTNAGLGFNLIVSSGSGFSVNVEKLELTSANVEEVDLSVGDFLTMKATNVTLDFNPDPGEYIATFGSISAQVTAGSFSVGGTARHFAIATDGSIAVLSGFSVSLSFSDPDAISWPSWLPIEITEAGLTWANFESNPADFDLTLSASVKSINGLDALNVQGSVEGLVIDFGLLEAGKFPIVDIGSAGVSVSGDAFGGSIEGEVVLGVVKLDANHNRIDPTDTDTTVVDRVLYGAISAGFSFAGTAGFSIRIGLSELGPLQLYMEAEIPVLLDPDTGLSLTDFRAGVTFDATIPDPGDDPHNLEEASYQPPDSITLADWITQLETQVANQASMGDGWDSFGKEMIFEAGATLYSAYLSTDSFKADIDFIFDTTGKFIIDADMVYGETLSQSATLYFDLSELSEGSGRILFLAREPTKTDPLVTIFGEFSFGFTRADGTPVSSTNQADSFEIRLSGGVDFKALSFLTATLEGSVTMTFGTDQFDLDLDGQMSVSYVGDLLEMSGALHIKGTESGADVWGAMVITTPALAKLEKVGVYANGDFILRLNFTDNAYTETLTLPSGDQLSVDLPAESFSVLIEGYLVFEQGGVDWFRMDGSFGMEVSETGLKVFAIGELLVGPSSNPWLTFDFDGLIWIGDQGVAALLDLTLNTGFPESTGITLSGSFHLQLNTSESGETISYTLPDSIEAIPGGGTSRTLTISGTAPIDDATAGPYLVVTGELDLSVLSFDFTGSFDFVVTTDVLRIEADATLQLAVEGVNIFELDVKGGFQVDGKGIVAALEVSRSANSPDPSDFGFTLDVSYLLELNTTNAPAEIGGVQMEAGRYARVRMNGDLVIEGFTLTGQFDLTVGEDLLEIGADAAMDLAIDGTTLFAFKVGGGFQIDSQGIAAAFDISLSADIPDNSFTFDVSFTIEVNMTGEALTLGGIQLEAGPFARVAASGTLGVEGIDLVGDFALTVTSDYVRITADAALDVTVGEVDIFSFSVAGDLQFGTDGLAAVLDLTLKTGPPSSAGFSVSFTFGLQINTTNAQVVFPTVTLDAGIYATILGNGDLIVGGLTLTGSFEFTVGTDILTVAATASLDLKIDGTTLLSLTVAGGMQIDSQGLAAVIDVDLAAGGGLPSGYGISLDVSFQLQINTRTDGITLAGITLDPGPYGRIQLSGDLTIFGFEMKGTFFISVGTNQFTLGGSASFSIFDTSVQIVLDFGMFSDGMAGKVVLALNHIGFKDIFTLNGDFGIEFNTTNRTVFDIDPLTGQVFVTNAELEILGLTLSGSLYIGFDNGAFQILVPASDPLTVDFYGIVTLQVYGYVRDDGHFSITGSVAISLGRSDIVGISGDMSLTIADSGLAASINGSLVIFNQSVASLSGYVAINGTGLRIVADVKFKLPDPFTLIALDGHIDATISSSGIKGSISATVDLWNFLKGSVGAYLDTSTGSWFVSGTASVHVGNSWLGASGSISIGVGYLHQGMTLFGSYRNAGFNTQVHFDASAWAGISIAGHHIGISGGISADLDLSEGEASVTIHGKVLFIHFSKTITVEFKNGLRVHLSDVAGSTIFLDVNGNGILDEGEPTTIADDDGSFSFAEEQVVNEVAAPADSPFALIDTNDDGLIDNDEGQIMLTGGTTIGDGAANTSTITLEHNLLSGVTAYSGATVFVDTNGNQQLDDGEYSVTTNSTGTYDLGSVLLPTQAFDASTYLGSLASYDTNGNGVIDADEGTLYLTGGTVISSGDTNTTVVTLDHNAATGFTDYADAIVFLDLNGNGTFDDGEPTVTSEDSGAYSFVVDATPDTTALKLGELDIYDVNDNGVLDADEGQLYIEGGYNAETGDANTGTVAIGNDHLSGYAPYYDVDRIFFDANGNGQYDDGEVSTVPDSSNFYTFTGFSAPTNGLGSLAPFDTNGNGVIDPSEGTFRIVGGKDTNNGLTNEQTVAIQADGAGSGVRHIASPLTSLLDNLQSRGIEDEQAQLIVAAALGMPYYIDFETFDPSVEEAINPDSGFHHEVEGVATQVGAFVLNGADTLVGAANGNLSADDAQAAILEALADRMAQITPDDSPPTDSDGNLVAADAKLDLTDETVINDILQDAAGRLQITYTEEPSATSTSAFRFTLAERTSFSRGPFSVIDGAVVQVGDDGSQRLVLPDDVAATAANIIGIQNRHIDELVDARVSHITEALARVKAVAQGGSSDRLTQLALGGDSAASIRDDYDYESLLDAIDVLDLPYPNEAPVVSMTSEAAGQDNAVLSIPFTVFDPDALPNDVVISVTSSDPRVVAPADVSIEGEGSNRTLVIKPNGGYTGLTTLTITVSDEAPDNPTTTAMLSVLVLPEVTVIGVEQVRLADRSEVLRFTLGLSAPSNIPVAVGFQTVNGTAQGGLDYLPTQGTLEFPEGATALTVDVPIVSDYFHYEATESVLLKLEVLSGGYLDGSQFEGLIEDRGFPVIVLFPGERFEIGLDELFAGEFGASLRGALEIGRTDGTDFADLDDAGASNASRLTSGQWTDLAAQVELSRWEGLFQIGAF